MATLPCDVGGGLRKATPGREALSLVNEERFIAETVKVQSKTGNVGPPCDLGEAKHSVSEK